MASPQVSNRHIAEGNEPSKKPSTESSSAFAKKMLTAVNFFVETNRLEPYTAVYLIQIMGWNEVSFGIVSLVMNMTMLVFQTPAGDLLDKTKKSKKIITTVAILIAAITTTMVVWTTNFWAILIGKTVEGLAATIFLPALMALILGICKTDAEVPTFIATTEVSNKIGSFLIVCVCAATTYWAYPNVEPLFYLLGAGGLAAAILTLAIPESALDHDRARQLEKSGGESEDAEEEKKASPSRYSEVLKKRPSSILFISSRQFELSGGESEDDDDKEDIENDGSASSEEENKASPSRYCELLKNRSILIFSFLTFMYHLANAGVVPLLAQYVAKISSEQSRLTWTSAILIVFFLFQAITAFAMSYAVERFDHKRIMIVAFVVLPVRCAMIACMVAYWNNPWALVATQILDGVGAGVYDIMLPIVVKKLTKGTGRFGFTFGFTVTCWRIGHGLSLFLGEVMVHSFGYSAAFWVLCAVGLLNLIGFVSFFSLKDDPPVDGAH